MEYKNQHVVTESYLRAWCDPATPNGAFVWVVSKKDRKISRKSPRSLFSEDDFYTYYDSSNNRCLELEHKLKEVEDRFILLRDEKLKHHITLKPHDRQTLALFASSTFARTKRWKEDGIQIWQDYIALRELLDLQKQIIIFAEDHNLSEIRLTVGPQQLFGLELNPYAHQLAQITAWIGYIQWRYENGFADISEPILKELKQIENRDAILHTNLPAGETKGIKAVAESTWEEVDVIIGNPPFLGAGKCAQFLGMNIATRC